MSKMSFSWSLEVQNTFMHRVLLGKGYLELGSCNDYSENNFIMTIIQKSNIQRKVVGC